ncbi:MAG: hypothetical protein U1F11_13610 [Steroidobacteraceae bacterium]
MRAASIGIAVAAAVARTWKPALVGLLGFQSTARPEVVRVDGVRLEVRSVEFRASPPETLARLRESWGEPQILRDGEHGAAPVRYVFGRQDGPRHLTLTLAERERGRLGGVLAVQDLSLPTRAPAVPPLRMPNGMHLVNVVEYAGRSPAPVTFTIDSRPGPAAALQALVRSAQQAGWSAAAVLHGVFTAQRDGDQLTALALVAPRGARVMLQYEPAPRAAGGSP